MDPTTTNDDTVTAVDVLERELEQEREAAKVFSGKTDCCWFDKGYISQQAYACLTCTPPGTEPAGMCYSCHIMCHGSHEIAELFVKRNFRCDCGTARLPRKCTLQPKKIGHVNTENRYNHNFERRYCSCDTEYDPDQEQGIMYQCLVCQDWFHDRCLPNMPDADAFSDLICQGCVRDHACLARLEPLDVVRNSPADVVTANTKPVSATPNMTPDNAVDVDASVGAATAAGSAATLLRLSGHGDLAETSTIDVSRPLYLPDEWRKRMCQCAECAEFAKSQKMPFLLAEEEVHRPEEDEDAAKPLYESGMEMLASVDRVKANEGVLAMATLSANLKDYLRTFAEQGRVVTKDDIDSFFVDLRDRKRRRTE
ncbi:putative E3 ubiquitin-protein ligase ubr7 [Allomyces arbusculus]|nr:putative E3 ubiquitin-protein ligase ubr7 [Allomyces arbusculus]